VSEGDGAPARIAPPPTVAVVIPTRDRPGRLARCLEALAGQVRPPDEVVVVDDGSARPASEVADSFRPSLPITVLREDVSRGPAAARNRGWRAATAEYVAFTDDDCRPDSGWLAALAGALHGTIVAVGRTLPDPIDGRIAAVTDRSVDIERLDGGYLTCNIAYPRALLARLDGFDERFRRPFGEDTDLGQRAIAGGARPAFVPSALVYHAIHHFDVAGLLKERSRLPELVRLVALHPGLRRERFHGWFLALEHRFLLESIAAVALLPFTPAGLILASRYLHRCAERNEGMPAERRLRDLAGRIALDGYELALCVRGSIEHRTVLL
jgi:glycosyltransferase involved in cell wall biosynthesis